VLLSGSGSDGTEGLKHIKSAGGITFAQDSESAEFAQMPSHAINAGCVDMVLAPAAIAQKLVALRDHPFAQDEGLNPPIAAPFKRCWSCSGSIPVLISRTTSKAPSRGEFGAECCSSTLKRTRSTSSCFATTPTNAPPSLAQDFLINVTALFRDPEVFDEIKLKVLPHLLEHKENGEGLRVWVPGCSTGEEAYSLAIIIAEYLGENDLEVPVQIFATDLDGAAIATARGGVYTTQQVALLTRSRLHRYFVNTAQGHFQVKKKYAAIASFRSRTSRRTLPLPDSTL